MKDLDGFFPPCGPCAFCGFHDKRHRLWDMWIMEHDNGWTVDDIYNDYKGYYPREGIELVLRERPYYDEE